MLNRTIEFMAIFIAMPLALFFLHPAMPLYPTFFITFIVSLYLLCKTLNFNWRELFDFHSFGKNWKVVSIFFATCLIFLSFLTWHFTPDKFLASWAGRESVLLRIMVVYPFLSALPQEIIYRALFFKRYGQLFRNTNMAIIANASCFSLFHLFYQNWFAVGLTFIGGLAFAWAYTHRRSFTLAWVLHSIAGQIIFAIGLGSYFYSGAIG